VTTEGRLVGAALMLVGVGLFGVLTAYFASRFVQAEETGLERDVAALRREVAEVRRRLEGAPAEPAPRHPGGDGPA
jgi:voltage-gated potassium channel